MRRWLVRGFWIGLALFAAWLWFVWPPPLWYRWIWPRQTAFMAMRRDQAEAELLRGERVPPLPVREYRPVPLARIAPVMQRAVLIGEDRLFREHAGIDYQAVREAMGYRRDGFALGSSGDRAELLRALRGAWRRRDRLRGASTITQQLAKNLYLSPSRNPLRKLKEALTAWRLEYWLGKDRILELYLNVVELGGEVWGVEAASRRYFGHSAARLDPEEASALAGTLPFPLSSNPGYRPARMRWRQQLILRRVRGEDIRVPRDVEPEIPPPPPLPPLPPVQVLPDTLPALGSAIRDPPRRSQRPQRRSGGNLR